MKREWRQNSLYVAPSIFTYNLTKNNHKTTSAEMKTNRTSNVTKVKGALEQRLKVMNKCKYTDQKFGAILYDRGKKPVFITWFQKQITTKGRSTMLEIVTEFVIEIGMQNTATLVYPLPLRRSILLIENTIDFSDRAMLVPKYTD